MSVSSCHRADPRFRDLADGFFDPVDTASFPRRTRRDHGHQLGVYNPNLGDRRGFLYAQVRDALEARVAAIRAMGALYSGEAG